MGIPHQEEQIDADNDNERKYIIHKTSNITKENRYNVPHKENIVTLLVLRINV